MFERCQARLSGHSAQGKGSVVLIRVHRMGKPAAGRTQPGEREADVVTQGGLGRDRRGGQTPGSASPPGPPLGGGDAPSRAPVPHSSPPQARLGKEGPAGAPGPPTRGVPRRGEPPGAGAPSTGLRGGD